MGNGLGLHRCIDRNTLKLAGVDGFGFHGVNAEVIFPKSAEVKFPSFRIY